MQLRLFTILFFCFLAFNGKAESYPEVVFDNSLVKGTYARSIVNYSGDSWVENIQKNLLVSDTLFFTPGNALSLKYISAEMGDWDVLIKYSRQKFHYRVSFDDILSLKIFVGSAGTKPENLPSISIQQGMNQSVSIPLGDYIEDYNNSSWMSVKIPLKEFAGLNIDHNISGIFLRQHHASEVTNQLFLDQIEFLPTKYSEAPLTSNAVLSKVTAYGKHVDLQWQVPLTPSIRYVKIYRSLDNKEFKAVAIRPTYMLRSLDYIPVLDKKYYYKIAWVDYNYRESPFSEVLEVEPKQLNEDQLLDLIQLANVNYFVENYDINSGMYMPYRMKDKAVVSVRETGGAMLSMLVGVEKGFVSKALFLSRVKRIVGFLGKAQNNKGFFPAYFDGRKGLPLYLDDIPRYDVQATSSLIEALLVIRQYLNTDAAEENKLRADITQLWERLDWRGVTLPNDPLVLRSAIDMLDEYFTFDPLVGINGGLNAYMLAIASTKSSLAPEAFTNALKYKFERPRGRNSIRRMNTEQESNVADSVNLMMHDEKVLVSVPGQDSIYKVASTHDTLMYGIKLPFGNYTTSLLDMYRPFNTINPNLSKVGDYDLKSVLQKYTQVAKRRDNEIGVGTSNSDIWGFYQYRDSIGTFRINPAIAISSMFLDESRSKRSLYAMYNQFGEYLFTEYGFRAWMDLRTDDVSDEYIANNQSNLAILLENARTGLIWNLYQAIPEIRSAEQRIFKK
ncbi:glucoamylase family protein [Sphingobacterium mizutaii]|uniref:glucoamylase family protein n=1 Tax=Sphingobacterium mizutaii TaxID=1010 RepID=UPI0028AEB3D2|nr:glucoamylase family protein [Sphingobacterium mizutaii]